MSIMICSSISRVPCSPLLMKTPKRIPLLKCRSGSNSDDLKDAISGIVGEQVEELLSREENKVLLDRLDKASQRVEIAKRELAFIQKQELALKQYKDYTHQLEQKAFQVYTITSLIPYFNSS